MAEHILIIDDSWIARMKIGQIIRAAGYEALEAESLKEGFEALEHEKPDLLLLDLHHRVKNNMSTMKGLLSLQVSASDNPAVKTALGEALNRVGVMAAAYEDLSAGNDYSRIPIKPLVRNIISSLSGSHIMPGGQ